MTLIYKSLYASGRVTASWTAVSDSLTLLVICVYGYSGAPCDPARHSRNNQLYKDVFEMVSQFGNIPVAIVADWQAIPHSYPSVREACARGIFHDILMEQVDDDVNRPVTYSRNCKWELDKSGNTSIDGILLNDSALQYLVDVKVIQTAGLQHAFIDATFEWPTTKPTQASHNLRWIPHAGFDFSKIQSDEVIQNIGQQLWDDTVEHQCSRANSADEMMDIANNFAIQILLKAGAQWKHGSRKRGCLPSMNNFDRIATSPHAFAAD